MLELVPKAAVHHIGMYKREMMPVQYYNRLPRKCEAEVAYILDPIIATSNTVMSVIGILKKVRVVSYQYHTIDYSVHYNTLNAHSLVSCI